MNRFIRRLRGNLKRPFERYCVQIVHKQATRQPVSTAAYWWFRVCSRVEFALRNQPR